MWHGEFGHMPISQRGVGRDHNRGAMTVWMAGAGIKSGQSIGLSDESGYKAQDQPVSSHDLHATILHWITKSVGQVDPADCRVGYGRYRPDC